MYIVKYLHTPNIVHILHTFFEKQTKTQTFNSDNYWSMKIGPKSDDFLVRHVHHTPNKEDLLLIIFEIWTWLRTKLNLVHWSMKWGRSQMKTVWRAWGPCKVRTFILLLIIRKIIRIPKNLTFVQVVTEPWKWGQEKETHDSGNCICIQSMKVQCFLSSRIIGF